MTAVAGTGSKPVTDLSILPNVGDSDYLLVTRGAELKRVLASDFAGATGATGEAGKSLLVGSGAPTLAIGVAGDSYIDKDSSNFYGPRTTDSWGPAFGLVTTITDGSRGDINVAGATWSINAGVVDSTKLASGISAAKLADGSVSDTEFQYLNGVTSGIQSQLDNKLDDSQATAAGLSVLGAVDAAAQRTALGLGTIATQASSSVILTGGSITGITDLAVADGGTGASDAATARTNLGLVIGTDVQAYDAELSAIAGLVSAANTLPYFTGSGTAALTSFTAAGRALVDDADAAAQRTTLGLGTIATQASSSVSITGGSISGITDLAIADGGTGASTAQAAINNLAGAVTSGQFLRGNGTNVLMSTIQASDVPTLNQNTTGTSANVTGIVAAVNGGTGQSSYAVGDLLYASTTTALSKLADVATGSALISGGVGVAPSWGKIGLTTHVSGTLPLANGGTGGTDAATARTNLGLVIGTNVQAYDAELAALAGLVSAANTLPYFTGSGTAALTSFTAAGRALVDDVDAAAQRTTLGVDAAPTYGTYTPTLVSTGCTFTYSSQVGKYAIYGKYCKVTIQIVTTNATGTLTNGINVVLPFATLAGTAGIYRSVATTYAVTDLIVSENSSSVNLFLGTNGSYGAVTPTTAGLAGTTRYINIDLFYQITA